MLPFNYFVPIASVILLAYLSGLYRFLSHFDENKCGMTYMYGYPQFFNVPVPFHDTKVGSQHYQLYLYSEGRSVEKYNPSFAKHFRLTGIPVLFIPGNGGSYRQVRSLASVSLRKGMDMKSPYHFDFFSLDLNEEYSALFGGVLEGETKFAQESIKTILSLYPAYQKPMSIILVGHSMGGLIAKGLMLDDNFDSSPIKVIVTLASPHIPVVLFDEYLAVYYRKIQSEWEQKHKNITLVSVGGGNRDLHVRGALTYESSADVNVLVTGIPGVWKSTDHLCITWCKGLIKVINRAFYNIIDLTTMQVHNDDSFRREVFQYHFLSRSNGKFLSPNLHSSPVKFESSAKWIELTQHQNSFYKEDGVNEIYYLMVPIKSVLEDSQYEILTINTMNIKATDWIFACQSVAHNSKNYCHSGVNLSKQGYIIPSLMYKRKQIHISITDFDLEEFSHFIIKVLPESDPISVDIDIHQKNERIISTQIPGYFTFEKNLIAVTQPGALTYTILFPNLENEIQAGYLSVKPLKCDRKKHHAFAQTNIPWSHENTHAFFSNKKYEPLFLKLYRSKPIGDKRSAAVSLTLDSNCVYKVSVKSSLIDSLGAIAQIFSPALIPNIIAILLLTTSAQLKSLAECEDCFMYHSVLVAGAKPLTVLLVSSVVSKVLSTIGILSEDMNSYYQGVLWIPFFNYAVAFAVLYFVGFGLWYSLIFSTSSVSDFVISFMTKYLGNTTWSEWVMSALAQLPVIISAFLVMLASSSCGVLSLWLGTVFYYLKLCSLYEDYLNYWIYYPFRYLKNQLKQKLSWKTNSEITDLWLTNFPKSSDEDGNNLTPLHFHFTLFLLWTAVSMLNIPSALVWAHNYSYKANLYPDPSWLPGIALSLCAPFLWPDSCPNTEINYYREISYVVHFFAYVCIIFCQHAIYRLNSVIALVFVIISIHQFLGTYILKKKEESTNQESELLPLVENDPIGDTSIERNENGNNSGNVIEKASTSSSSPVVQNEEEDNHINEKTLVTNDINSSKNEVVNDSDVSDFTRTEVDVEDNKTSVRTDNVKNGNRKITNIVKDFKDSGSTDFIKSEVDVASNLKNGVLDKDDLASCKEILGGSDAESESSESEEDSGSEIEEISIVDEVKTDCDNASDEAKNVTNISKRK